jgi:hypothetical protein
LVGWNAIPDELRLNEREKQSPRNERFLTLSHDFTAARTA